LKIRIDKFLHKRPSSGREAVSGLLSSEPMPSSGILLTNKSNRRISETHIHPETARDAVINGVSDLRPSPADGRHSFQASIFTMPSELARQGRGVDAGGGIKLLKCL
jgi:hypothetical protein